MKSNFDPLTEVTAPYTIVAPTPNDKILSIIRHLAQVVVHKRSKLMRK